MKHFVYIGVLLILLSTAVQAETMYVSDLAEITLRTGKGIDHKIIAMVKSGTQVEVLEPDDQWTKVRLPGGKEGWMVSRFLTSQIPCNIALQELKKNMGPCWHLLTPHTRKSQNFKKKTKGLVRNSPSVTKRLVNLPNHMKP